MLLSITAATMMPTKMMAATRRNFLRAGEKRGGGATRVEAVRESEAIFCRYSRLSISIL